MLKHIDVNQIESVEELRLLSDRYEPIGYVDMHGETNALMDKFGDDVIRTYWVGYGHVVYIAEAVKLARHFECAVTKDRANINARWECTPLLTRLWQACTGKLGLQDENKHLPPLPDDPYPVVKMH